MAGSSPRVRGTESIRFLFCWTKRFIPACAGNSRLANISAFMQAVHPRVCGEQSDLVRVGSGLGGSSPRVRRTVKMDPYKKGWSRFIPACAGNSPPASGRGVLHSVHPRVCGEQICSRGGAKRGIGSSPRVRGTGPSRRVGEIPVRFIPACAGNSHDATRSGSSPSVHPRVCGEQITTSISPFAFIGSSPRVRGTVAGVSKSVSSSRFIPACAGNRSRRSQCPRANTVHPRVCGEQRRVEQVRVATDGSSPRVRGTVRLAGPLPRRGRFIPACAGNRRPV